jgi:plastocyanin
MKKLIAVIVVIVIIVIAWLVFGGKNNDNGATTNNQQTSSKSVSANQVTIQNFAFSPADITVKKGTKVTWTNRDSTPHTITQDDNQPAGSPGLDSKGLSNGESYSATFDQTGTFHYHCSIHPEMTGSVTVTE